MLGDTRALVDDPCFKTRACDENRGGSPISSKSRRFVWLARGTVILTKGGGEQLAIAVRPPSHSHADSLETAAVLGRAIG